MKKQEKICFECHDKEIKLDNGRVIQNIFSIIDNGTVIHDPVISDGCSECHNPHGSTIANLLVDKFPAGNYTKGKVENFALCFACHDSEMLTSPTAANGETDFRDGTKNLHYLHIKREKGRSCIDCHNVHATTRPKLIPTHVTFGQWDMPIKFKKRQNGGTCLPACHGEKEYKY